MTTKVQPTVGDYQKLAEDFKKLSARTEAAEKIAQEFEVNLKNGMFGHGGGSPGQNYRGSDEQKAMTFFGVTHVKDLFKVNTEDAKFSWVPPQIKGMVRALKHDLDVARVSAQLFHGDGYDTIGATEFQDRTAACKNIGETMYFKEVLGPKLKSFGTGVVGAGAEWIPTIMAAQYIPELELDREIVGLLKQINMPHSPYELPTSGFTTARKATENVTATDTTLLTGKLSFAAKKFLQYFIFPEELREESLPDIVGLGRMELTDAHLRAFETCLINGDGGVTHQDNNIDLGAADLAEKNFDGLRKIGIANTANGGDHNFSAAVIGDAGLRIMRKQMGKFGVNPKDLVWVCGATGYHQMLNTTNVTTVEKYGPNATILKGELGSYDGISITQSGFIGDNLSAAGFNTLAGPNTFTTLLLLNKKRLYWATRRPIVMAVRPSKSADDRIEMASYSRVDFKGHPQGASTSELTVVVGRNILL